MSRRAYRGTESRGLLGWILTALVWCGAAAYVAFVILYALLYLAAAVLIFIVIPVLVVAVLLKFLGWI